jgi:hypothetical protein
MLGKGKDTREQTIKKLLRRLCSKKYQCLKGWLMLALDAEMGEALELGAGWV